MPRLASTVVTTPVQAYAVVPTTPVCGLVLASLPGGADNTIFFHPHQTPLHSAPALFPVAGQAMSHDGSPSPDRSPTKEKAYDTTLHSHQSGPASEHCSPLGSPSLTSPWFIVFEPPSTMDTKLDAEASQ